MMGFLSGMTDEGARREMICDARVVGGGSMLRHLSRDNICIIDLVYVDTWVENSEDG